LFDFHSFFALGGQTLCKISEVLRKTCSRFHVFVIVRLDRRVAGIGIVDGNIDAAEGGYGLVQGSANALIVSDIRRIYLTAAAGLDRSNGFVSQGY